MRAAFDWSSFLHQWNDELLRSRSLADRLRLYPDEDLAAAIEAGWLGYPGAMAEDITQGEQRLGTTLPPSYRAFLMTSNGWRHSGAFVHKLWSTTEIEWLTARHRDGIDGWLEGERYCGEPLAIPDEQYFVYGEGQDSTTLDKVQNGGSAA